LGALKVLRTNDAPESEEVEACLRLRHERQIHGNSTFRLAVDVAKFITVVDFSWLREASYEAVVLSVVVDHSFLEDPLFFTPLR
jgi:hypothetical protein